MCGLEICGKKTDPTHDENTTRKKERIHESNQEKRKPTTVIGVLGQQRIAGGQRVIVVAVRRRIDQARMLHGRRLRGRQQAGRRGRHGHARRQDQRCAERRGWRAQLLGAQAGHRRRHHAGFGGAGGQTAPLLLAGKQVRILCGIAYRVWEGNRKAYIFISLINYHVV